MKCLKIPRRYLIYSFSFFAMFLFSFLLCSPSSYAVNTFEYTWSDTSSSVTVTPPSGHIPDNTYCGYKYFYAYSSNTLKNHTFYYTINNNSTNLSLPSYSTYNTYSIYSEFTFSSSSVITNCRIQSYRSSLPLYVFLSDEPINVGVISPPPSGSFSITENGTYDVTNYAEAVVDIPPVMGDYHDDLVNIKISIIMCAGVLLVLYFFYCIYRLLIKSTGGWR